MKKPFHLLDIESLTLDDIYLFLNKAKYYLSHDLLAPAEQLSLQGKIIINLFFENSTRTLYSFEIAEKKLGAHVISFNANYSSTQKGETLGDTALYLKSMGAECFVVRHPETGAPAKIAELLKNQVHIVNGGDGTRAHPTQALLDVLTISLHKKNFENLSVAIIGDIKHSRVARSLTAALKKLGTTDIRVTGPAPLLPDEYNATIVESFEQAVRDVDVIVMLRIQHERFTQNLDIDLIEYFQQWGLNDARLKCAKPDAIVLHPGPMNREVEIASHIADGPQSVIFEQAHNGVAIRMAVLDILLNK